MSKTQAKALQELIYSYQYAITKGEDRLAWVEIGQKIGQPGVIGHLTAQSLIDLGLVDQRARDSAICGAYEIRLKIFYERNDE